VTNVVKSSMRQYAVYQRIPHKQRIAAYQPQCRGAILQTLVSTLGEWRERDT